MGQHIPRSAYSAVELLRDYATQQSSLLSSFLPEYDVIMAIMITSRGLWRRNYARNGLARLSRRWGGAKDAVVAFRLRRRNSFGFTWYPLRDACVLGRAMIWRGTEDTRALRERADCQ